MTNLKILAKLATLAPLVVVLACVAGQKVDTTYSPEPESVATDQGAVTLSVTDQREYVLSGDKDPSYIGKFRAGFGNTWDVKTEGQVPLAQLVAKDLGADLEAESNGRTALAVAERLRHKRVVKLLKKGRA